MKHRIRMRLAYKIVMPQIVLALLLLAVAIPIINNITLLSAVNNTAERGYAYGLSAVKTLDAQLRLLRSTSNYIAENNTIQHFFGENDDEKASFRLRLIKESILPSEERRSVVGQILLYSLETSSSAARQAFPVWTDDIIHDAFFLTRKTTEIQWIMIKEGVPNRIQLVRPVFLNDVRVGMLVIRSNDDVLASLDAVFTTVLPGRYIMVSEDGITAWRSVDMDDAAESRLLSISSMEGYHNEGSFITYVINSSELRVKIIAEQSELFTESIDPSTRTIALLSFGTLLLSVLATIPLFISVSRRLTHVADCMALMAPVEAPVRGSDEIAQLANAYNDLLVRMEHEHTQMQEARIMQQEAAYRALQAQIQPHFLYNTLETLRMMAEGSDEEELADTIALFGRFLRASISPRGDTTTIGVELDNVRDYFNLYALRIPRLQWMMDIEPDTLDVVCPRFILQPLVENAIKHGIEKRGGGGMIHVCVHLNGAGDILRVDVQNDGAPLSQERIEQLNHGIIAGRSSGDDTRSTQIGLSNVASRIRIFYGKKTTLQFIPVSDGCLCRMELDLLSQS